MKHLITFCCILLLAGCAAPGSSPSADIPPVATTEEVEPEEQTPAAVLSLSGVEPAGSRSTMETPDTVSADTMGEILCDETLPDGTEIVCYWAPGTEYTKYWAIRQGDALLRFCEEESCYRENYRVEPFSDVLGHDGFRILCPRGASYDADDYYYLDGDGVPRLLAGCSGSVLDRDVDNDGQRELLWQSGGAFPSVFYVFQREGVTCQADLTQWLRDTFGEAWLPLPDWEQWEDGTCTISLLKQEEDDLSPAAEGYVVFTEEDVRLFLPEGLPEL